MTARKRSTVLSFTMTKQEIAIMVGLYNSLGFTNRSKFIRHLVKQEAGRQGIKWVDSSGVPGNPNVKKRRDNGTWE